MNKRAAAEFLGKTERAVERYTEAGKLSVRYKPGKTRPVADYDEDELARLRHDLENPSDVRPLVAPPDAADSPTPTNAVQLRQTTSGALERQASAEGMAAMLDPALADALRAALASRIAVPAPSLLLTIPQAAEWLGVSKYQLEIVIGDGKLTAPKIGRGRRVRPEDLLRLKDDLFNASATKEKNEREDKAV
jgi:excisionase family DNA binding protein